MLDTLVGKRLEHHLGAGHFLRHGSLSPLARACFASPGIKKGLLKAPVPHRRVSPVALATVGGAPLYRDGNYIAHCILFEPFPCAVIGGGPAAVKHMFGLVRGGCQNYATITWHSGVRLKLE